ncbi:MAG TPA: hypothetical protein VFU73_03990 [Actinocrinis sp.]|nr:hypothetical protein [Actinocrinis sp.]
MGTDSAADAVNTALREYAARIKRLQAAEKLAARAGRGEFDDTAAARSAEKAARQVRT